MSNNKSNEMILKEENQIVSFIKQHPVTTFFILTIIYSWIIWGSLLFIAPEGFEGGRAQGFSEGIMNKPKISHRKPRISVKKVGIFCNFLFSVRIIKIPYNIPAEKQGITHLQAKKCSGDKFSFAMGNPKALNIWAKKVIL